MKAAVVCSKGIGDGLMMMVASHRLRLEGYEVTTFQDELHQLKPFFPGHHFEKRSAPLFLEPFDLIFLQNDNSAFSKEIIEKYRSKLSIFYASYEKGKHPPLTSDDWVSNRTLTLTENISLAITSRLKKKSALIENGLTIPDDLIRNKEKNRIVIHPTSSNLQRNWKREKYLKLAKRLSQDGYRVVFAMSPKEKEAWQDIPFDLPHFPTLSTLASYLYESFFLIGNESGTGHLASNLGLNTLIIARSEKEMALWRPGFLPGKVITPKRYIPNFKFCRFRDSYWAHLISSRRVYETFQKAI